MGIKFSNNASSTLATGITAVATSLTVDSGDGALFPAAGGSDWFYCTLIIAATNTREIVKVTSRTGDVFTITRAQEGTTATAFSTGDLVRLQLTAAALNEFVNAAANTTFSGDNTFSGTNTFSKPILSPAADIASAATLNLTAATGGVIRITGTTATSSVTLDNGQMAVCVAAGAWPLTHHATNHPLPGSADYTCTAGDLVIYWQDNSGVKHSMIRPVNGGPVVSALGGAVSLTADVSPSQITANQDDYSPTGLSTASTLRLNTDASRDITGLAGGADGRILVLHNVGSNNIVLKDDSASSTAGNRFALSADITLGVDQAAVLQYDSTSSRWRCIALPAASSSSGLVGVTTFSSNGTWTKPGGCNKIVAMAVGGGGAGGGSNSTLSGFGGEAGAVNWAYTASPASSYSITIGAGGTGVSAANGNNGSATTVGALLTAAGGNGGLGIVFPYSGTAGASCRGAGGAIKATPGAGNSASVNTGAGGGGAGLGANYAGGAGGSGYVIIWEFA